MAEDQKTTPKLSERFSDLFGVDESDPEYTPEDDTYSAYLEESRKLNLNKLLHLAPYSEVLLLLGQAGVGRTTLLKAFVQRAATTWRISFVSASALMDGMTFLRRVGAGFELDLSATESIDDMLWEIDRYLQALGRSGRRAIVIIDDAHLLTDEVILLAEKILRDERTEDAVSLVLSMRQDQGDKLNRFALLRERLAYTITLEPMSRTEVDGYLRHCLAAAGAQFDRLLTPDTVAAIHRESGGLPEQINARARELLHTQKSSAPPAPTGGKKRPVLTITALVLVGVAAATVLFFQDEINQMLEVPEQAVSEPPVLSQAPASDSDAGPEQGVAEPLSPLEDEQGEPVELPLPEEADERDVAQAEQAPLAPQPELGTVTEAEVAPAEAIEPDAAPAAAATSPSASQPQAETAAPPATEPEPEPPVSPQMAWLLAQPGDHYTLQLMALVNEADVTDFIAAHDIAANSATFPITRRGKVLTVLVYGSYPSRSAASEAAAELPKAWGVGQPWIRQFAAVQQELDE